jgi:hypothetical protein
MSAPVLTLFQAYAAALSGHALRSIAEGYARMDHAFFADAEEPAITGELVARMRDFLESGGDGPAWRGYYSIHDDPPLNVVGKLGKSRPRVDIEFERVTVGKRPRLRFEAKRLDSATRHTVRVYLGDEGLGCFLSGKYPTTHAEAGMLGYVQSDDEPTWAKRISSALERDGGMYGVVAPAFGRRHAPGGPPHTFVSHHDTRAAPHVTIFHVLLRFLPDKPDVGIPI